MVFRYRRSRRPARFPSALYGRAFVPRGTEFSLERYGATANLATPLQLANRRLDGWVGQGKYTGGLDAWDGQGKYNAGRNFRKWATGAVRNVGRGVGAALNQQLLGGIEAAGDYAGTGLYTGRGIYTGRGLYSSNNLIDAAGARQSMEFASDNDETQALVISHKEYVGDVFAPSTAAFTNTSYSINPGLQQNFPFLAQFAQNFDEYTLIQMVWEFHSTIDASATNNTAGNTGTIVMATNYKADALPFTTKEEMIQYHGGVSGRLTEALSHGVECDPDKNSGSSGKYIRTSPVVGADLKTFDVGLFQLALQNIPSAFFNQQVGELWVFYKVKLSKPKLFASLGNGSVAARYVSSGGESEAGPLGSRILSANNNSIALGVTTGSKGVTLTFPAAVSGVYEIKVTCEGTSFLSAGSGVPVLTGNISAWSDLYATSNLDTTDSPFWYRWTVVGINCSTILRISVLAATGGVNNTVTVYPYGISGTATTVTQSYVEVSEVGTQFATSNSIQSPIWVNAAGAVTSPIVP